MLKKKTYNSKYSNDLYTYIKRGQTINAQLRDTQDIEISTKKLIKNLDIFFNNFENIGQLFDSDSHLFKVYRTTTTPYDSDKTQGYMSTSNKLIPMSKLVISVIFIPKDVVVAVTDISKGTSMKNIYEITLNRNTFLKQVVLEDNCNFPVYIVDSKFFRSNQDELISLATECKDIFY